MGTPITKIIGSTEDGNMILETVPLIIGGQSRQSPNENKIAVRNAAQDRMVGYAEAANPQLATEAVQCAADAFAGWSNMEVSRRRKILFQTVENFRVNQAQLSGSLQEETSCTKEWAAANIMGTLKSLQELACNIGNIGGEIAPVDDPTRLSLIFKVPLGAVLVIAP